ncbi:hypothetical protein Q7C36_003980 [Tachysurus vachellii]|uniref:CARD domain-containing protein n=1 Tax=Tachysurus vachellii TaxID=175792 RepID=A0AA88TFL2_TACVA|nr:hypothetical protein Q7C36_003980 [Tachysurus vachellii]
MASSNQDASEYIKDALEKLVGRLQNLPVIVEKLHQQNVFNGNEVSEIEAEPEKYNKTRRILDLVLNKGEKACYKFLRILDRERKLVLPKSDSTSQTPDLHTWISLFSFRDEAEDDYIKGPLSCHQLQKLLKTRGKLVLSQQWSQSLWFNEDELKENAEEILQYLQEYSDSVTIVFDGIRDFQKNTVLLEIMEHVLLPEAKIVVTCRPEVDQSKKDCFLDLENSAVSLSGLKIILKHYLRDFSTTLSQIWTIALKCEEPNYLINLLQLCRNEIHIPMSSQTDVLEQAGKFITRYAEQPNLHLHCDKDPQQLTDLLLSTAFSWLPHISSLKSHSIDKEKKKRWRKFLLDLCLQTALHQPQNIQETVKKVMPDIEEYEEDEDYYYEELSEFLLDLFSHVKQYESETHSSVLPALLPVYRSHPAVRFKVFYFTDEEKKKKWRKFLLDLCLQTALHQPQNIQETVEKVMPDIEKYVEYEYKEESEFLLDLFSHVKQYESETHSSVLPVLLTVYQSLPAVRFNDFYFTDREKKKSWRKFLLDLCLQTALHQPQNIQETVEKVMPEIEEYEEDEDYYFEEESDFLLDLFSHVKQYESETHSSVLPALLPVYRSHPAVSFEDFYFTDREKKKRWRKFLLDLCLQTALHQPQNIQETVEKVMPDIEEYEDDEDYYFEEESDFLLDLFSHVKQYENETHRTVLPALLPVYRSHPAVSFEDFYFTDREKKKRWRKFLLDLCLQTALHQPQNIQETVEKVMTGIEEYEDDEDYYFEEESEFLLDLFSHVKQYESETHSSVLPALLPVYWSHPAVSFEE